MSNKIKYGNISIAPNEIDPDGSQYDLYKKNQSSTDSGGSAAIPTCTVRFKSRHDVQHSGSYSYTKCENGVISLVTANTQEFVSDFDITFENVVCNSVISFGWLYLGDWGDIAMDGNARLLTDGMFSPNETTLFGAPATAGEICTIEFYSGAVDDSGGFE